MTLEEKAKNIIADIKQETGTDPVKIFKRMAQKDYVAMHGPEHHVLDGACLLVAFKNAGGQIDLDAALEKMQFEGLRMPGAMCGLWGVCGAITSMGAALSIIDKTGPLTTDGSWGEHMKFTSQSVADLGKVNGPRCCKRDGILAFHNAVSYINEHYPVTLTCEHAACEFKDRNQQCIKERCPFFS